MNVNKSMFFLLSLLAALATVLAPGAALAQDDNGATAGPEVVFALLFAVGFYLYSSSALQTIAQRTGTPNTWFAWIPPLNIFLMLRIAERPGWWFMLFLIPIVGLIITIVVWTAIAERVNKPGWWGIMVMVPVMNLIMPGYLAWAD